MRQAGKRRWTLLLKNSRQYSRPMVPGHLLPTLDAVFCGFRSPVWVLPAKTPFFAHLGSPNDMCTASICNIASSTVTPITVLGMYTYQMVQDVEHSDYIIAWGKNSFTDDGPQLMLQRIKAAQTRGANCLSSTPAAPDWAKLPTSGFPLLPAQMVPSLWQCSN